MKRKRGHMKGKTSKKSKSSTEVDSPVASVNLVASDTTAKSVGRVKVKLKTSKAAELDVDKTSPKVRSKKPVVAFKKKEEPVLRLPERKRVLNVDRKTKGIKIKSSKPVDGSSSVAEKSVVDAVKAQDVSVLEKDTKTPDESSQVKKQEPESEPVSSQNEQKKTDQSSRYKKQELKDSLTVIKKILKMKAAYPFNVPLNRKALGIPDYFDVIKLMDFGTVSNNLEKGNTYMNSEDVYKDVQDIWNICPKKGHHLMKRVKKKFMKHWTAAGLYTEQSAGFTMAENKRDCSSSRRARKRPREDFSSKRDCKEEDQANGGKSKEEGRGEEW